MLRPSGRVFQGWAGVGISEACMRGELGELSGFGLRTVVSSELCPGCSAVGFRSELCLGCSAVGFRFVGVVYAPLVLLALRALPCVVL